MKLKKDHESEMQRCIKSIWKTSRMKSDVSNSKIPTCLKRKVCDQCIISTMTYVCKTLELTKAIESHGKSNARGNPQR